MVNGLIHPIVKVIFYVVVLAHNGENKSVKCVILVKTSILHKNLEDRDGQLRSGSVYKEIRLLGAGAAHLC